MKNKDKEKLVVYAIPVDYRYSISADKLEEFEKKGINAKKKTEEKKIKMKLDDLNIKMKVEDINFEGPTLTLKKKK